MNQPWTATNRDALLARVTALTAGTAVVGAVGAMGLGAAFAVTAHSKTVTAKSTAPASSARVAQAPSVAKPATVAPSQISVQVLNGTGVPGAAHAAANDLSAAGFHVVGIGNASGVVSSSIIAYAPGQAAAMRTLAASTGVGASTPSITGSVLVLVVGPDWAGSVPAAQPNNNLNPPPAPPIDMGNSNGGSSGVSGGS